MAAEVPLTDSLISLNDSALALIDVQDHFLDKLPVGDRQLLLSRIGWAVAVAARLQVPVLATAEDMDKLGGVSAAVAASLPNEVPLFNKMAFSLVSIAK